MNIRATFAIVTLVLFSSTAFGQYNDWEIQYRGLKNGKNVVENDVSLLRVTADSLEVVRTSGDVTPFTIPLESLIELRRREEEPVVLRGIMTGLLIGGGVGYMGGRILDGNPSNDKPGTNDESNYTLGLALAGGAVGSLVGGLTSAAGGYKTYNLARLSDEEKEQTLREAMGEKPVSAAATNEGRDVLYLKNGIILRGMVTEIVPDSIIRISTRDGSLFVFRMTEVERMAKGQTGAEPAANPSATPSPHEEDIPDRSTSDETDKKAVIGFHGGVVIPAGDFGSTSTSSGGGAKTGFYVGGDIVFPLQEHMDWTLHVTMSWNSMDIGSITVPQGVSIETGKWFLIWPMTGVRFHGPIGPTTDAYGELQAGMLFGNSPELNVMYGGSNVGTQPSASATSFSLGVGVGLMFGRTNIGARLIFAGSPEYEVKATSGGTTQTQKLKQATSMFLLGLGFTI